MGNTPTNRELDPRTPVGDAPDSGANPQWWPPTSWSPWLVIVVLWAVYLGGQVWYEGTQVKTIPYSEFLEPRCRGSS